MHAVTIGRRGPLTFITAVPPSKLPMPDKITRFLGKPQGVTREQIEWCYRTLLHREPESDEAVNSHLGHRDLKALMQVFLTSAEYRARFDATDRVQEVREPPAPVATGTAPTLFATPQDNETLALAEYRDGVLFVRSTPRMITLETTSRCNLRCVMCPQGIDAVDRPKHLAEPIIEGLQRFIGQAKSIQLHGIGEPLASPGFWTSLGYIPAGCNASINTNLTVLDDQRLHKLVASNIALINVSLDAATALTYQRIRGFPFEEVLGNIRRFVACRTAAKKRLPLLYMNMTMMRSNIEEVPAFIELAADCGADQVHLWHLNRWSDEEMARYRVERDGWCFDYAKEGLWNYPELSNRMIRAAQEVAKRRGIGLYLDHNKKVFFDEEVARP